MLWLLHSAPLRPAQVLRAKLASTLPPLLVMAQLMAVVSCVILGVEPVMILLGSLIALVITVAVASLSTGLGALLPDYRAETAAKVAASFGGLVCMSVALLVGLALICCFIYPAMVLYHGLSPRPWVLGLSVAGVVLITALSTVLPLKLGARALERLEP